jgi:hypothetical protein
MIFAHDSPGRKVFNDWKRANYRSIIYISLMKRLIIILCLLPSIKINAQIVDFNHFSEKRMNEVMFIYMNDYTKTNGGYSLTHSSVEETKIYRYIKKNNERFPLNSLISKINEAISVSSVAILDSISCKDIKEYQEIASRCITDWADSPSDVFFMIGWGYVVEVTSYYSIKTGTIYISVIYLYT